MLSTERGAARGDSPAVRSAESAPASPVRSMSPRSDLGAEPHAQSAGATGEVGPAWRLPVKQRLNIRESQAADHEPLDVEKDLVVARTGSVSSQFLAPDWPLTPGNVSPTETLPNPSPC